MQRASVISVKICSLSFLAVMIAIKYNEDKYYEEGYYARIAGIKLNELIALEREMLWLLRYKLCVASEVYEGYLEEVGRRTWDSTEDSAETRSVKTVPSVGDIASIQ
eukprot:TRINITY_DN3192_c0_g5_i1.p1 TRINITY_DN3192_c0_g5~~TRINITY_DN3192_c0_g5_i1.p1  ORF type:complete len:107 (-),score=8.57 TRINITY_DN3192_c0_g5_i1:233-553(-)